MAVPVVAVHAGAGYHSDSTSRELTSLCRSACKEAIRILKEGKSCNEATAVAISVLEDSPLTNTGLGSNLSLMGQVECDASIMDGTGGFGAVGGLQGVANPITVATRLQEESSRGSLPLGRVPPLMLVGDGARLWAKQHGIPVCNPEDLITDRAREVYLDHKARLDDVMQLPPTKKRRAEQPSRPVRQLDSQVPLDTVGAVCVDSRGGISAGVSSGGISLKFPGRVGQAGMYGCGCWAEDNPTQECRGFACSTSGTGEYIIKTLLARECTTASMDATLQTVLEDKFLGSKALSCVDQKLAGVIAVNLRCNGTVHLCWGHTTESMCIGYMRASQRDPLAFITKTDSPADRVGKSVQVGGVTFS